MPNIFINIILHNKKKYIKIINKIESIISKVFFDQYKPFIQKKLPKKPRLLYKNYIFIVISSYIT